jgi:hypothetical protein
MRSTGLFAAVHFIGNALLLWLGYEWLGMGESRAAALAGSFGAAAVILCFGCWLYGASFDFFDSHRISQAFGTALRRLPALILAAILVLVIYYWLARANDAVQDPGFTFASWLTNKLRKPVKPVTVQHTIDGIFWVIRWFVLPILLLPMAAAVASRGWSGFKSIGAGSRRHFYWVKAPVLLLLALWVPLKLMGWSPHLKSFGMEMTSFVVRAAVAYLLFVFGWLLVAFVTSAGKPVLTKPKTVPSP